jgi:hypothetical protein
VQEVDWPNHSPVRCSMGPLVLAVAQLLALAAPRPGQAHGVDVYAKAGSDGQPDQDCVDRFQYLMDTMVDPTSDDVACKFNKSQEMCPPGCQGNITALLHDCINTTYNDTEHRKQFWDEFAAAQLQQNGPKGCNYSVPARPPQPPPPHSPPPPPHSPPPLPPRHDGWMPANDGLRVAAAVAGGLVAIGACGLVIKRRNQPAADSVREGLLQDVGEGGGSE